MVKINENKNLIKGKLSGSERGFAFLLCEGGDYFIARTDLHGAMHGDEVLCREVKSSGHSRQAQVIKILTRGTKELVGTFASRKSGGYVVPDEKKIYTDVFIPFKKTRYAKNDDKVAVKITSFDKRGRPEGEVVEILGRKFDRETELKCIELTYKLNDIFPRRVAKEADYAARRYGDKLGRTDFTEEVICTIDGEDARDFDDAISITKNADGTYNLGVHIADVAEYVRQGSELDKEAFERATSVYFPEKVIPMLPERLCNDVCSLMPGVERLTLSCVMRVDGQGKVLSSEIVEGVIKSAARMTYKDVQKILDGDKMLEKKYSFLTNKIALMNELASILIEKRNRRGSINLEVKEADITVRNGKIDITEHARAMSNRIIEEFMILANETVAEKLFFGEMPCVYRVHEKPSDEKMLAFDEFIKGIGVTVPQNKDKARRFDTVLAKLEGSDLFPLVNRVMLRSMQKAKYSPDDIGHFGLASEHYCHFTSPIRRYPDLAVHRIIKAGIAGERDLNSAFAEFAQRVSTHASEKERTAQEAERAADDFYKTMYISAHIGEEFEAVISGVTNFGLFAELENTVEGLIRIEKLTGGWYDYDEKNLTLKNKRNSYKLGQKIRIRVDGADLAARRAEFGIVEEK